MQNILAVPRPVVDKLDELNVLIEKYPAYIPLTSAAAFLGMHSDGLRASIEHGGCPFGIAWQKDIHGNRAFKIPTPTFYLWYTQGGPFRWQAEKEGAEHA